MITPFMKCTRVLNFLFKLSLIFCLCECRVPTHKTHAEDNVIVYHVFDSIENVICNRLKDTPEDPVIAVMIRQLPYFEYNATRGRCYSISLLRQHKKYTTNMIKITNRKIDLCGKLYQVFLPMIDDILTEKFAPTSNLSFYMEDTRLFFGDMFFVDMDKCEKIR